MANTDFIDKIVSKEAYQDVERTNTLLDELYDKFTKAAGAANIMNRAVADATGLQGLTQASEQLNQENEQLLKLQKQIADTITKRNFAESQLAKTLAEEKILLQQTNKDNANAAKINLTTAGSIARMEAIVLRLRAKQKDLNLTTEEGQKKSELYKKSIDKLNESIKANSDAAAKQRLNVGNYQGSAKIIVESLKSVEEQIKSLQAKQTGLVELGKRNPIGFRTQGGDKQLGDINAQLQQLQANAKVGDQRAEIGFFRKELINLEDAGLRNSKAYKEVQQRLAQLTDQVADTKDEIKALSSDTRGFDLFAGSVTFAADAFQTFAGAAQLAGVSQEDAARATATLVAVQSVSNGVKGIATELTTKGTAANQVYAFTQNLVATAFDRSATSARRFQAALGIIGLALTIIGAVIMVLGEMNRELSEAEKQQKALNDVMNDAAAEYGKAKTEVAQMTKEIDLAKRGMMSKEDVLKKYNETIGSTIGQAKDLNEAEKIMGEKADDYIRFMFAKAQAAAAFALANKAAEESVKNETATTEELLSTFDKIKAGFAGILTGVPSVKSAAFEIAKAEENRLNNKNDLENRYNQLLDIGNKKLEESLNISKENNFTTKEDIELEKERQKKIADAAKKRAEEYQKRQKEFADFMKRLRDDQEKSSIEVITLAEQRALNNFQRISANEQLSLNERLLANTAYFQAQEALIKKRVEQEQSALLQEAVLEAERILGRKLTGDEIVQIEQATQKQRIALQLKGEDEIVQVRQDGVSRQTEIIEQEANKQLAVLARASEQRMLALNFEEQRELQELEQQLSAGAISREAYEKKKLDIQNKYIEQRLAAELEAAEEFLKIQRALGVDTTDAEKRITDIKLRLAQDLTRRLQEENQKQFDDERGFAERKKELLTQLYAELKNTLFTFVNASFEKQKNAIQQEIDLIDQRKQAEINRINTLQVAEEEKANKLLILEAQSENQKRILEQRQRDIEVRRAKFNQKVQAGIIAGETIKNVASLLGDATKAKAQAALLASNPLTLPFAPAALAAAGSITTLAILTGSVGAARVAQVLGQAIPEYYTGTEEAKEGLAWVGERGRELVVTPQGQVWETPGTPTLTYLQAGTKVINNEEYLEMLKSERSNSTMPNLQGSAIGVDAANIQLTFKAETDKIVKAIQSKPDAVINVTDYGIELFQKRGMSWTEYLNKRVRFKK